MLSRMAVIVQFFSLRGTAQTIKEQFLKGASTSFLTKGFSIGAGFLSQVLLARMMGPSEYGVLVYALSWANILAIFPKCGFDVALLRYIAEYRAKQEWGKLKAIVVFGAATALFGGIIVAVISASVAYSLRDELGSSLLLSFCLAFATLPFLAVNSLRVSALYGLKRVFLAEFPDGMVRPIVLTAAVAGIWAMQSISVLPVLISHLMVSVLVFGIGGYGLVKSLPVHVWQAVSEYRIPGWLRTSIPLMGMAGMQMAMNQMDVLMIGSFLGMEPVGTYSAAARLSDLVVFGLTVANSIMAPLISELFHTGRIRELQQALTYSTRMGVAVTVLAAAFLVVLGDKILWLFGNQFVSAYQPMLILIAGQVVNASCGSVGFLMTMTGNERRAALVIGGGLAINIALNLLLIPSLGVIGAALATASGIVFWNVVLLAETRRHLGVDASIMARAHP